MDKANRFSVLSSLEKAVKPVPSSPEEVVEVPDTPITAGTVQASRFRRSVAGRIPAVRIEVGRHSDPRDDE